MPMSRGTYSSSIAVKLLVALTGLGLCLYLVVHVAGNLLLLLGPSTFNGYAHALVSSPLVVPVELGLLAIFLLHVYNTVATWWAERKVRPVPYQQVRSAGGPSRRSLASTTMIYTGAVTFVFVVLHVRMFKYGTYYQVPGTNERDLFRLVIEFFRDPLSVVFYEACLVLLGFHLWHGASSAPESLGINGARITPIVVWGGRLFAVLISAGFLLIPLWVYFVRGKP